MNRRRRALVFSMLCFLGVWYMYQTKHADKAPVTMIEADAGQTVDLGGMADIPKDKRTIRVLTTYSMTNYYIDQGQTNGFEYALVKDFETALNKGRTQDELPTRVVFIPTSNDRIIPSLTDGKADMAAAGLTITKTRRTDVDFSIPYLTDISEYVVSQKELPAITDETDLSGRRIAVRASSSYFESIQNLNGRLRDKHYPPVEILSVSELLSTEDLLEMVNAGIIDYTMADSHIATLWAKALPNLQIHSDVPLRTGGKLAWMLPLGEPAFKKRVDAFLRNHRQGTLKGNMYFNRYFDNTQRITNPLSGDRMEALRKFRTLFEKNAQEYGLPWLLLAAVAYQESGLDNDRTSPRGAVGIMQVLPSLETDHRLDLGDVHTLEGNIHAGAAYLDLLRKSFTREGLKRRESIRFALAAYNMGPNKLQRMRERTREMHLDPDKWFGNVELATLQTIGMETVRYVRNVTKYYIGYSLSAELISRRNALKDAVLGLTDD